MNTQMSLFELMPSPAKSYHNTVQLSGNELLKHQKKAEGLKAAILDFFERHPGTIWNAEMVHGSLNLPGVPLWSVRARMSDLVTDNKLTRLRKEKTLGSFGHSITFYRLVEKII